MKVLTYNILADAYVKPERYQGIDPQFLKLDYRKKILGEQLLDLDADILCLQEVEFEVNAYLEKVLDSAGYRGIWAKKGMGRPDGVATFFRKNVAVFTGAEAHYFRDQRQENQFPSGHVALILYIEWENKRIGVLTSHIRWDEPEKEGILHVGYRQMQEVVRIIQEDSKAEEWIVCGDFNAEEDTSVLEPLYKLGLVDVYKLGKEPTISLDGVGRVDYIFHTPDLKAWPQPLLEVNETKLLPSKEHPSDHAFVMAKFE